ncbi:MAG TPA: thioredoxin domain-containing protein [Ignavibacteria bacterium]|nr:thioredoxin domain-containing protein [Ignavibacteria bacterium]
MKKRLLPAALFFTLTGAGLALYATNLTFKLTVSGLTDPSGCSFNDWLTCDTVLSTGSAKMFGVPVAWWGFLFYLWSFFVIIFAIIYSGKPFGKACAEAVLFISVISVLFTFFKIYQLAALRVICPLCAGMYISNFAVFLFLMLSLKINFKDVFKFEANYLKSIFKKKNPEQLSPHPLRFGVIFIWLFAMGFLGLKYYENTVVVLNPLKVKLVLNEHFKQLPANINTDGAPLTGNPNAKVKIVVFSDFQCPSCRLLASNMKTIMLENKNDISYSFINYPLDSSINKNVKHELHKYAGISAIAGVCAAQHGKFWELHDELFENQTRLDREFLIETAVKLGMDKNEFTVCMDSEETRKKVISNIETAEDINVSSTPSLFINGRKVKYWNSPEIIRAIIKEEQGE